MILAGGDRRHLARPGRGRAGDVHVADGRVVGAARGRRRAVDCSGLPRRSPGTSARTRTSTRRSPGACPTRSSRRRTSSQILQRDLVAARPGARRGDDPRLRARRRDGGAARRARRRSSTTTPRRTRSTARSTWSRRRCAVARRPLASSATRRSDRDGPERALAGVEENRRFLARVRRERPPLARGMVGAHASFTLSDETLAACVEAAARRRRRHPRPRRRGRAPTSADAESRGTARRVVERLARRRRARRAHAARARRPPRRRRDRARARRAAPRSPTTRART